MLVNSTLHGPDPTLVDELSSLAWLHIWCSSNRAHWWPLVMVGLCFIHHATTSAHFNSHCAKDRSTADGKA